MNGRDRWVPALFIYEKDMAPTDGEKRASGGGGGGGKRRSPGDRGQPQGSTGRDEDEDADTPWAAAAAAAGPAPQSDEDWADVDGMSIEEVRRELVELNASDADVNQTDLNVLKRLLRILRIGKFEADFERVRRANITEADLRGIEEAFKRARERAEEANQRAVLSLAREHPGSEPPDSYEMYTLEQQFARQMFTDLLDQLMFQIEGIAIQNHQLARMKRNLSLQRWMYQQLNSSRAPAVRATTNANDKPTREEAAKRRTHGKKYAELVALIYEMMKWEDPIFDQLFEPDPEKRWKLENRKPSRWWEKKNRSAWRVFVLTVLTQTWQWQQGSAPTSKGNSTLKLAEEWMEIDGFAPDDWKAQLDYWEANPDTIPPQDFFNFGVLDNEQLAALISLANTIQKAYNSWFDLYTKTNEFRSGTGDGVPVPQVPHWNMDPEVVREYERVMEALRRKGLAGRNARAINRNDIEEMTDTDHAAVIQGVKDDILRLEREILEVKETIGKLRAQMESGAGTSTAETTEVLLERQVELQLQLQATQEELCRSLPREERRGLPCDDDEDLFSDDGDGGDDGYDDGETEAAMLASYAELQGAQRGAGPSNTNREDSQ